MNGVIFEDNYVDCMHYIARLYKTYYSKQNSLYRSIARTIVCSFTPFKSKLSGFTLMHEISDQKLKWKLSFFGLLHHLTSLDHVHAAWKWVDARGSRNSFNGDSIHDCPIKTIALNADSWMQRELESEHMNEDIILAKIPFFFPSLAKV